MPSTMIHLFVAYTLDPCAPVLFGIGNFAPDATNARTQSTRQEKDALHFRNDARWDSLQALAQMTDPSDPFAEGWLLHLYTDACWDEGPQTIFSASPSPGWFAEYRRHIGLAGLWIFRHYAWVEPVWSAILSADITHRIASPGPTAEEIAAYRDSVYAWHSANTCEASTVYTPQAVEAFVVETVLRYRQWRSIHHYV